MKSITAESWDGPPILACEYQPGSAPVQLSAPLLMLWPCGGMWLELRTGSPAPTRYRPGPGRFDLLPSGVRVGVTRAERVVHPMLIEIPADWVSRASASGASLERVKLQFRDPTLERLVRGLDRHRAAREPFGRLYTEAIGTVIEERLIGFDTASGDPSRDSDRLPAPVRRRLEELIDAQLDSPPTVASLAALAGLGTFRFLRRFKATFGVPLHRYVLQRRIEKAKRLLASPSQPLITVALELGFASHAHFTTAFRAHTGVTPTQYRRCALRCDAAGGPDAERLSA